MAGRGVRFVKAGYKTLPKPLIELNGHPMIWHAVKTLDAPGNYIFVVLKEHLANFPQLEPLLLSLAENVKIITTEYTTEGPASSCLLAKNLINNNSPLLIANCDQIMQWNFKEFLKFCHDGGADGVIVTYTSSHKKNSFIKTDNNNNVVEVKEKIPISNIATIGIYWWRKGRFFVDSSLSMIKQNERYNNEFYVGPAYNQILKNSRLVSYYHVAEPFLIGTPEDLEKYLRSKKNENL